METEIIEGNKLIHSFMDFKTEQWREDRYLGLPYKTDWSWLMPVVEKIESIYDTHHGYFQVHISSNSCSIQGTNLWKALKKDSKYEFVYMSDPNAVFDTKIESTWYHVVKFINWYNKFR